MLGPVERDEELDESVGVEKGLWKSIAPAVGALGGHKSLYLARDGRGKSVCEPKRRDGLSA